MLHLLWRGTYNGDVLTQASFCKKLIEEKVLEVIVSYITSDELSTDDKKLWPCLNTLHNVMIHHYSEARSPLCDEKLLKLLTNLLARGTQDNISTISRLIISFLKPDLGYDGK